MPELGLYSYKDNSNNKTSKIKILENVSLQTKGRDESELKIFFSEEKYLKIANQKLNCFLRPLYYNILKFKNFEKGDKKFNILKILENPNFYSYISKFDDKELLQLTKKINYFTKNELTLFIYTLYEHLKLNKSNIKKTFLEDIVFRIHKKILKKGLLSNKFYQVCPETYKGFLRALKSGTLYTQKTSLIDGKPQRVYIKGPVGNKKGLTDKFGSNWCGFNRLMIDNKLNVYSFKTDSLGRIIEIKPQIILENIKNWSLQKYGSKKYVENFRKEFTNCLDKAYAKGDILGTERIRKIYNKMKDKTIKIKRK